MKHATHITLLGSCETHTSYGRNYHTKGHFITTQDPGNKEVTECGEKEIPMYLHLSNKCLRCVQKNPTKQGYGKITIPPPTHIIHWNNKIIKRYQNQSP